MSHIGYTHMDIIYMGMSGISIFVYDQVHNNSHWQLSTIWSECLRFGRDAKDHFVRPDF